MMLDKKGKKKIFFKRKVFMGYRKKKKKGKRLKKYNSNNQLPLFLYFSKLSISTDL